MTSGYPTGAALVTACAAGQGAIVLVEGDDDDDDPYFYGRWFGDRALQVSFFPQNGWPKVVIGVAELRRQFPNRKIFGLVDRDFATDAVLAAQDAALPSDGILRTRRYTLENYLLEAAGWFEVVKLLNRSKVPADWASIAEVQARIEDAYRRCIPLAAWNHVVHEENARTGREGRKYREHPGSIGANAGAELAAWGHERGAPAPLDRVFDERVASLQAMLPAGWAEWITGKAVLRLLCDAIPAPRRVSLDILANLYLDRYPQAPQELVELIDRVV